MRLTASRTFLAAALAALSGLAVLAGGARAEDGTDPAPKPPAGTPCPPASAGSGADAVAAAGKQLHNFFKLSEKVYSAASPESEADFVALAAVGVKVIVSVDGSRPFVESAERHGLRYVHLPIGYDGITDEQALRLTKCFTSLEGPFLVHCHHGKHRGPAAATIARIVLDHATPEQAVAEMKRAGTDPKYKGLYAVPASFHMPSADVLAKVPAEFPSVAAVPGMQQAMVEADQKWERMKSVRVAKWSTPKDHPDVDPPHEGVMIAEWFRELARRPDLASKPADFRAWLADVENAGWELEKALKPGAVDSAAAEAAFDRAQRACSACHAAYRDNTRQTR
jgi:protein tyrosine phosphatase (PTP) superfamily phosphohydrolase (DUF442 family)